MSTAALTPDPSSPLAAEFQRLLVTVRRQEHSGGPRYCPIGILDATGGSFEFTYLRQALELPDFVPLINFPDLHEHYRSSDLFALFSERVMSPGRPDRDRFLAGLGLHQASEPWEVLARSGGRRQGDTIEVLPLPCVDTTGHTSSVFLVHGVRYRSREASDEIGRLRPGVTLTLRWDTANPRNPRAVLVNSASGHELGFVPDPLVEYVHDVMADPEHRLEVIRAHGPEVVPHLRLLVRLSGHVPVGYQPLAHLEPLA